MTLHEAALTLVAVLSAVTSLGSLVYARGTRDAGYVKREELDDELSTKPSRSETIGREGVETMLRDYVRKDVLQPQLEQLRTDMTSLKLSNERHLDKIESKLDRVTEQILKLPKRISDREEGNLG